MPAQEPEIVAERGVPLRRLADPDHLRAMAHPRRLAIVDLLVSEGPMTATACAERLGDSPASCSYHLRQLARYGFVEEAEGGTGRQRPWRWVPVGNRLEFGDGPAQQSAAVEFLTVLDARNAERVEDWRRRALTDPWREIAGSTDWLAHLTEDELRRLGEDLDAVLTPYQQRLVAGERSPGSRPVDILIHLLPRASHGGDGDA